MRIPLALIDFMHYSAQLHAKVSTADSGMALIVQDSEKAGRAERDGFAVLSVGAWEPTGAGVPLLPRPEPPDVRPLLTVHADGTLECGASESLRAVLLKATDALKAAFPHADRIRDILQPVIAECDAELHRTRDESIGFVPGGDVPKRDVLSDLLFVSEVLVWLMDADLIKRPEDPSLGLGVLGAVQTARRRVAEFRPGLSARDQSLPEGRAR